MVTGTIGDAVAPMRNPMARRPARSRWTARQTASPGRAASDRDRQRRAHAGDVGGGARGREQVGPSQHVEGVELRVVGDHEAPDARECLGERSHHEVDLVQHPLRLGAAEAAIAVRAEGVRLVHHEVGVRLPAGLHHLAEWRHVAVDRVEAFDDHEAVLPARRKASELAGEAVRSVVAEADDGRAAETRRVVEAGVAVGVEQHEVAGRAQGADHREVALVPGREDDGRAPAEGLGQLAFEVTVHCQGAVGDARSGGRASEPVESAFGGGDDVRVQRQSEIVVRPEDERAASRDHDLAGTRDVVDDRLERACPGVVDGTRLRRHRPKLLQQVSHRDVRA